MESGPGIVSMLPGSNADENFDYAHDLVDAGTPVRGAGFHRSFLHFLSAFLASSISNVLETESVPKQNTTQCRHENPSNQ